MGKQMKVGVDLMMPAYKNVLHIPERLILLHFKIMAALIGPLTNFLVSQ